MGFFTQSDTALEWRGGHEIVRDRALGPQQPAGTRNGVAVDPGRSSRGAAGGAAPSGTATSRSPAEQATITNGGLTAEISGSGPAAFPARRWPRAAVGDDAALHRAADPAVRTTGGGTHHFEVLFNARDGERFYGLGQHQHGLLNQKGAVIELVQRNTEVSIPFLVSNRGYGLLWNHPGDRPGRAGRHRHPLGRPKPPASGTTGSPPRTIPRTCSRQYGEVDRAHADAARVGGRASGSASSATRPRTSCSASRASTSGAGCRCR